MSFYFVCLSFVLRFFFVVLVRFTPEPSYNAETVPFDVGRRGRFDYSVGRTQTARLSHHPAVDVMLC